MQLECDHCIIRDWTRADRGSLLENANNRNVWRNLGDRFPHPYTVADADRWFSFLDESAEPTHWAIEIDGRAVGGVGVDLGELEFIKSGRFGYWLGEPFWNRGVMTQVVRATSDYALQKYGLVRLEAPVFEWNPASMRVLEKCGFLREGVLRRSIFKDGEIIDAVLYAKVL